MSFARRASARPGRAVVVLAVVGAASLGARTSSAQVVSNAGDRDAAVQIGFNGIIAGAVQLSVVGTGPTTLTGQVNAAEPAHSLATIDFGRFTTTRPDTSTNCDAYRVTGAVPGAVVAARLIAMLTYNGTATGSITVQRLNLAGGAPDVPLARLRIASPALATWTSGTDGTQVPDAGQPGVDLCVAAGDVTCVNGDPYEHQLAVFVPDSQLAGPFTTVVLYSGSAP